jgi:hypothetical protein
LEVAPVIFRSSARSRFRGDRVSAFELLGLLALAFVIVMVANDTVYSRVLALFQDLVQTVH